VTLILSALTHDHVVQVSDRRLSADGKPLKTPANKSVVLCGHLTCGYTGQAFIRKVRSRRT
jgi:hypothetical protein